MNYKKAQPIIIILAVIIVTAAGCSLLSNPIKPTTSQSSVTENDIETSASIKSIYDGLSGVELFNAVMVGRFEGKVMYKTQARNENYNEDTTIITYKSNGNFKEIFKKENNPPFVTIYNRDEMTAYTYKEGSDTGFYTKYEKREDSPYESTLKPLTDEYEDILIDSRIIDLNGRDTYYYKMKFEYDTGTYLNKYWVDLETKVQMKAEFYFDDKLVANSVVTELTDDFDATDMFMPPPDVNFKNTNENTIAD